MRRLRNLLAVTTALMPLAFPAFAGPNGGVVVGGNGTITNPGSANVRIDQFTQRMIINWHMFNIGAGEVTTFYQPNSDSIVLNRVTGGMGPSEILGSLNANGKVFVVNRDGIIFGAGAVINTAGFLATTSDIKNEDFMAGRFNFQIPGRPDASIVNMGTITAANGGFAALVAPGVRNSGTITANLGTVALGAGNLFSLDFYGDKLITLGVGDQIASQVKDVATGQTLKSLVTNEGKLKANGGRVELSAAAARTVVDSVINTSGVIEANSIGTHNGRIVLSAATGAGNTGAWGNPGAALPKQTVRVSGKLSAAGKRRGTKGGTILVTGQNIEVRGATIDASGRDGGGKVMIGGDWGGGKPDKSLVSNQSAKLEGYAIPNASTVSVDSATKIDASAKDRGDGGKVVLWANDHLTFTGTILALGGSQFGNGGFVETSAHSVDISGTVNGGHGGTWLLDPADLTINTALASTIQTALNSGTNYVAQTATSGGGNGDIIFDSGVRITWNTSATLTLIAFRNIQFNDGGFGPEGNGNIVNYGGAAGNLVMRADSTGTGVGTLIMTPFTNPTRINWTNSTGTISLYYNPANFGTQDNFTTGNGNIALASAGQLTRYMLVNDKAHLQNISTNLAGNYALGRDIDATGGVFNPLGTFTGIFDGTGGLGFAHTINNLTVAPTNPVNFGIGVGFFSAIGFGGTVKGVNFDNAHITANPNATGPGQFIGVLAGTNAGTISGVNITNSTVSSGTAQNGVIAGGLVGQNGDMGTSQFGTITLSNVQANVTVGSATSGSSQNNAGGIAGDNPGTITLSSASGDVSGGANSNVGGLVGRNESTASIVNSVASGDVNLTDATGSAAGGAVGFNFGLLNTVGASGDVTGGNSADVFHAGSLGGLVGMNNASGIITSGVAGGNVSAGSGTSAGGLVGWNNGTINGTSIAAGDVSSVDNFAGGFVAFNGGTITGAIAGGNVSSGGNDVGGFVGQNSGTITASFALGNVTGTAGTGFSTAGGFVGTNDGTISSSFAYGNVTSNNTAGGFAGSNESNGTIDSSFALGAVSVGDNAAAGGFAGGNLGQITNSTASGAVSGGNNVILGGFAAGNFGTIDASTAAGAVTSTGQNAIVGGFAGINTNMITASNSLGPVQGVSESYLGGFVGINIGTIQDSTTLVSASVTGTGAHNFAGGFAGVNFGLIDPSSAAGSVTSGANSIVGGFVGANGALQFPDGTQLIGTISPDSLGTGPASGGTGSTVGAQVGQQYPTSNLPTLPTDPCTNGGGFICGGTLFDPSPTPPPVPPPPVVIPPTPPVPPPTIADVNLPTVSPLLNITATLVADTFADKTNDPVVTITQGNTPSGQGGGGGAGGRAGGAGGQKEKGGTANNGGRPPANATAQYGLGPLPTGMPPANETRFLTNEVMFQLGANLSDQAIQRLAEQLGLQIAYQENVGLLGRKVIRFIITNGKPVRQIIAALEKEGANFSAQPIYQFQLTQDTAQNAPADTNSKGDSAQYVVDKLGLVEAHLIATGKNVKVAVIDSEIDANHPDLQGAVTGSYDALPSDDQTAHPHGTGMAGAIASHKRLLGVAPNARLLAVRAFGVNTGGAQGTSLNIVKGLQWAVDQGAKVINMSFAGPKDPILQQAIKRLTDQGIILIAAAGNAGPKSPPLFPGADPNVIAVSATDIDNKIFKGANRGKYVAIAAPGVDILVPAPEGGYQLTTGTSVAAAHISGVVALMLERNKELKPADVRAILSATAKNIGEPRTDVGAGLVDPVQALSKAGPKQASAQ